MNQFNEIVAGAISVAQTEAIERRNSTLEPIHLFHGLLNHPSSYVSKKFKKKKKDVKELLDKVAVLAKENFNADHIKPSPKFNQWLTQATSRAIQSSRQEVAESDLLFYLPNLLPELGIQPDDLKNSEGEDGDEEVPHFLTNLNELANEGKLDPVIGRSREIRALMEILGRRSKNNPVLVGEAGVGKTAVVEGLAGLIVKDDVPDAIKGKTLYSLDLGALMAGTKFRGEFEERLQKLLKFVKAQAGQTLLFIDEIHQLVGAGKTDGAMDAANLLKPALARGDLHCIGATTHDEFRKYILADSALERRFRPVFINEPTEEDSIEIMMGLKEKYEIHHGIEISDEAIFNSVFLSKQYIPDKNLPDKAIDLIDESAAALKLSAEAMPSDLVELQSEIRSKKIYSKTEKSDPSLIEQIKELEKQFESERVLWEKKVLEMKRVSELKNNLDRLKFDLEQAERTQNYEEASKIKYSMIPEIEKGLTEARHSWVLKKEHVAEVISRQTGIPVEKILKTKQENILEIGNQLNQRVFGQKEALKEISETLIAAHAGLTDQTRPLGSFMLLGPSGVGKTETAKALAQFLFNTEDNLIRLDLSEYSEKHSTAKLIGAAPGYIGYDEGGVLTEAVRKKPYSVILMDEVEKAHPDFADILLQILDDGRLTDNKGRTVSFRNTIVLLTSNSKNIEADFKPEVLGRLDAMLTYQTLSKDIMKNLIDRQVELLNERLKSKALEIELDSTIMEELAERGYDERYGARPLRSVFSRLITRPLSHQILEDTLDKGKLILGWKEGKVSFGKLS